MNDTRRAARIGFGVAALADLLFFATNPEFRAPIGGHHWVLYFYLTIMVWPIAAGVALAVLRARRPTRS